MQRRTLASLAGAALVLAACGTATDTASGTDAPSTAPSSAPSPATSTGTGATTGASPSETLGPAPAAVDHAALAFEAPLLDGGTFDGAVSGDVVLWFWAPW